jgi:hypothetical protein
VKRFRAKWNKKLLEWFWSGNLWYVSEVWPHRKQGRPRPDHETTGAGKTRDEAFNDYKRLNQLSEISQDEGKV